MLDDLSQFEQRKQDHIALALLPENQASECNAFDHLMLRHEALPDLNFERISLQGTRFNTHVEKPFIISSMTAGHEHSLEINRHLMQAASKMQWAMGVGSQRRELTDSNAMNEWATLRKQCPDVDLYGNIGIAQLITTPLDALLRLTQSLNAKALIVHCNPLQECLQPEGTPHFEGCWEALSRACTLPLPIIVKETGCGFSTQTLKQLNEFPIAAVDVSGLGGTHWGRIEGGRALKDSIHQQAAHTFRHWGINTITSVKSALTIQPHFEVWGSGGVRNGLDAAKLIALGATTVGFAKPMLVAALQSTDAVVELMEAFEYELRVAMFCTGSADLKALKDKICL